MATAPVSAESESGMHSGKGSVFTVTRPYLHTYINIYITYMEYVARQRVCVPWYYETSRFRWCQSAHDTMNKHPSNTADSMKRPSSLSVGDHRAPARAWKTTHMWNCIFWQICLLSILHPVRLTGSDNFNQNRAERIRSRVGHVTRTVTWHGAY